MGLNIVSVEWIEKSSKAKKWLEEEKFVISDKEAEKKWDFKLKKSINTSRNDKLLNDLYFYATSHTKPPPKEISEIVISAGGQVLFFSIYFLY